MVDPIYIFIVALASAFLLGLVNKASKSLASIIFYAALLAMLAISGDWLVRILAGASGKIVYTAGFQPPFSINLYLGRIESFLIFWINLVGLLSAVYLYKDFDENKVYGKILFVMLIMGLNGMIMTRDLFNLFVFLEISSIATLSLIAFRDDYNSLNSGLKYGIASGIASALFLLGTIFIYKQTGTLNIDGIINAKGMISGSIGFIAVFFLIMALIIELKPFPANGWALDVYESVNSGIVAIIAVANSGAMLYALYKLLPIFPGNYLHYIAGLGVVTFLFSNLMGLKQKNVQRLLGFSSVAQMGLLLAAVSFLLIKQPENLKAGYIIVTGIFLSHFIAKAGLFWISGLTDKRNFKDWKGLKKHSVLFFLFGIFIMSLSGLPPFPGFWAKWELVKHLFASQMGGWVWLILLGSLLEAVYLLRWFINSFQSGKIRIKTDLIKNTVIALFGLITIFMSYYTAGLVSGMEKIYFLPVMAGLALVLLDFLSARVKGFLLLLGVSGYLAYIFPQLGLLRKIFAFIFVTGTTLQIPGTMNTKKRRVGFYPLLAIMVFSLANLLQARTTIQFFLAWEFMTVSSWLLVMRGKKSQRPSLLYIIFSLGSAFLILAGFGMSYRLTGSLELAPLLSSSVGPWIPILLSLGFLIKTGAIGAHVWLPGSYAESEDDFTAIISSVVSKAGVFGLLVTLILFGKQFIVGLSWNLVLGWIGAITAFAGAFLAVFQEDIKKLLAYSSMGQIGYMVLALAINSHLGWVTALYLAVNHLFFKSMILMTIAGVIYRVKTRKMYKMGGLIKKMPFSFITVLIGIIALSGVPPLSGFGGKWMLYTALIEKGWYLQSGLSFFAGAVAFLYLFRLIHSIFLGQLKPEHRNIKESPIWYHIPSYIFIGGIMAISTFPNLIIKPLSQAVSGYFPASITLDNYTVISTLGYWNGNAVMLVTMAVFMTLSIFMLLRIKSVTKVEQFNIVYAAERPERPETTHVAYNFFAPYKKALGFLDRSRAVRFWDNISEWSHSLAAAFNNIYTGNAQTYALHIFMLIVILYLIIGVH